MITFDKINHLYYNEQGLIIPSVTQILNKVFGSGLEKAPLKFVERAAAKGSAIHEEIEQVIKGKRSFTKLLFKETEAFVEWACENLEELYNAKTEMIISVDSDMPFAGTCDLFLNNELYDYKTSKTADKKQKQMWQIQLSFYFYALKKLGYKLNKMSVLHLVEDKCEQIELQYIGDEEVENILKKYYNKETTAIEETKELKTVNSQQMQLFAQTLKRIKQLQDEIEPIRESIKQEMEKRQILSLKVQDIQITYIAPHKCKKFDSARFKAEHADLYKAYQKESEVKSSIRIS